MSTEVVSKKDDLKTLDELNLGVGEMAVAETPDGRKFVIRQGDGQYSTLMMGRGGSSYVLSPNWGSNALWMRVNVAPLKPTDAFWKQEFIKQEERYAELEHKWLDERTKSIAMDVELSSQRRELQHARMLSKCNALQERIDEDHRQKFANYETTIAELNAKVAELEEKVASPTFRVGEQVTSILAGVGYLQLVNGELLPIVPRYNVELVAEVIFADVRPVCTFDVVSPLLTNIKAEVYATHRPSGNEVAIIRYLNDDLVEVFSAESRNLEQMSILDLELLRTEHNLPEQVRRFRTEVECVREELEAQKLAEATPPIQEEGEPEHEVESDRMAA